jgi:hypothetical protein
MTAPPCRFEDIHPGSEDKTPCTPRVSDEFRGLALAAPSEVRFGPGTRDHLRGGFAPVIVAGVCCLEYQELGLHGNWNEAIVFVATDVRSKQVYSGRMLPFGSPAVLGDTLPSGVTHDDFAGAIITTCFNPNLARDIGLPEAEAEYDVYATLGPYRSNVVHVKVVRAR